MKDVSMNQGRTVLFVSHNLGSIRQLCDRGILLENGLLIADERIDKVLIQYALPSQKTRDLVKESYSEAGKLHHQKIRVLTISINGESRGTVMLNETENQLDINCQVECYHDIFIALEARIKDELGNSLASFSNAQFNGEANLVRAGTSNISARIFLPAGILKGQYLLDLFLTHPGLEYHYSLVDQIRINHEGFSTRAGQVLEYRHGLGWLLLN